MIIVVSTACEPSVPYTGSLSDPHPSCLKGQYKAAALSVVASKEFNAILFNQQ